MSNKNLTLHYKTYATSQSQSIQLNKWRHSVRHKPTAIVWQYNLEAIVILGYVSFKAGFSSFLSPERNSLTNFGCSMNELYHTDTVNSGSDGSQQHLQKKVSIMVEYSAFRHKTSPSCSSSVTNYITTTHLFWMQLQTDCNGWTQS